MSVKRIHVHDEDGGTKVCYRIRASPGNHKLIKAGLCETIDPTTFQRTTYAVAYMPYSGHWYAYDPETGRELATFTRDFYEAHIVHRRIGDLVADPDCVPA